jgi:hypothetical protein
MNWDRYLTVFAVVCCLVAVGTAAGTMERSIATDPDEAVDIDTRLLPIGSDALWELHQKVNGGDGTGTAGDKQGSQDADASGGGGGRQASSERRGDGRDVTHERRPDSGASERDAGGESGGTSQSESVGESDSREGNSRIAFVEPSQRLVDALLDLLWPILGVLAAVALLVGAGLAVRRLRGRTGGDERETSPTLPGEPAPTNDVSESWYEMTRRLGVDERHELTPSERTAAAIGRGVNREAAASLTELFEEVRYGGADVTDERRRRARRWLERLRTRPDERESRSRARSPDGEKR